MGVDSHVLRLLCQSRTRGVTFSSTMMIGRQNYYQLNDSELCGVLGITPAESLSWLSQRYIEPLLTHLGASRIESLDASSYEDATAVHDLNKPIPERLKNCFSCVFDGGTIEHVFNFPQALKNCMEMVAVGGHFIEVTTANNFMGHGFYQLSPELYYRALSPENGFAVEDMVLCETDRGAPWYRVQDPAIFGRLVELVNNRPTYIMVIARRVGQADIFKAMPQQSFYLPARGIVQEPAALSTKPLNAFSAWARPAVARFLPHVLRKRLKRLMNRRSEAFQSDAYRKV